MEHKADQVLAHYRLVEKIGEGGMGVVWRAVDTTLDREVAIKILPDVFASDRERLLRFEREAKVLASLNHAAIASIYGLHEHDGVRFLAMEFVPGDNLANRLEQGPLALEDAVEIGRQIAEALESAHEVGIVHRDLKPANVVVTPGGQVKVLDFGLAKAMVPESGSGELSLANSPTITTPATLSGTILGTAAYMSPEQARGGAVDKRADIWAFGCVLLEMLTGKRTFDGGTVSDTLAAVLRADIEFDELPKGTPSALRSLIARCLDRDVRTRLRDAGEARIVLSQPLVTESESETVAAAPARSRMGLWIAVTLVALVLGIFAGRSLWNSPPAEQLPLSFNIDIQGQRLRTGSIALSPDGRNLVVQVQRPGGDVELWLRPMDQDQARALPGTVGGSFPFWSPDSREIGFFAHNQLLRLSLDGSSPRSICEANQPAGGNWNPDGVIVFARESKGLHRVDAGGGEPVQITTVRPDEAEHAWPWFLPDGDHFLFLADANSDQAHRLCLARLSSDEVTVLRTVVRSSVAYDPRAGVLISERGQLLAHALDLENRTLDPQGSLVADEVNPLGNNHHTPFSISANGILALQHGRGVFELLRLDREGNLLQTYGEAGRYANPAVSPDGRRVLFEVYDSSDERLVWMQDLERGVRTPISPRGASSDSGTWSADGRWVYFDSDVDSTQIWSVFKRAADGGGDPVFIGRPEGSREAAVLHCSRDGQWLLVYSIFDESNDELALGRLDQDGVVSEWVLWTRTPGVQERAAEFSPDSRYVAYTSNESGRSEIYLAPVEGGPAARRWQISTHGGVEPRFSPDGRYIYYRSLRDHYMSVAVQFQDGTVDLEAPQPLFEAYEPDIPYVRNSIDVFPDGSMLVLRPIDQDGALVSVRTAWWPEER